MDVAEPRLSFVCYLTLLSTPSLYLVLSLKPKIAYCMRGGKINWNANMADCKVLQFNCILSGGHKLNMAAAQTRLSMCVLVRCVLVCTITKLMPFN